MKFNHRYFLDYVARELPAGGKALDYGCGRADMVAAGVERGLAIYGADVFYKDGSSREEVERKGLLGSTVREIRNGAMDFPDAYFDLVVSNQVFEHVQNLDAALAEIARVLKPGGTLHTLFPVLETWWEGHFGVPFLHNFKSGGRLRTTYARTWFKLGLGYHHAQRDAGEWADYVCNWVDQYTVYRPKRVVLEMLERRLGTVRFGEDAYLRYRLRHAGLPLKPLVLGVAGMPPVSALLRGIYRKRGGVVLTVRKTR